MFLKYLLSFGFIFFAECFLTFYAIKASQHKSHAASVFAALNTLLYCMNIENIITDNWCIFFSVVGAYCGTRASVFISKRFEQ